MDKIDLPTISLTEKCLDKKVILITGASRGIGRALAIASAAQGATVILTGKTLKKLESVYDEIVAKGYPEPAIHPINFLRMEPKQAQELAHSVSQMFGRLDALVHNAGLSGPITPIEHLAPEKWQEVIQLNLNVPYLLTHMLLPLIKETPQASILFTLANESYTANAYWSAYNASKFGLLGFAQTLHQELEVNTDIRVNCINPGIVRTALRINAYPGIDPNSLPLPEEIMTNYLYLLCNQAKAIRGKCLNV